MPLLTKVGNFIADRLHKRRSNSVSSNPADDTVDPTWRQHLQNQESFFDDNIDSEHVQEWVSNFDDAYPFADTSGDWANFTLADEQDAQAQASLAFLALYPDDDSPIFPIMNANGNGEVDPQVDGAQAQATAAATAATTAATAAAAATATTAAASSGAATATTSSQGQPILSTRVQGPQVATMPMSGLNSAVLQSIDAYSGDDPSYGYSEFINSLLIASDIAGLTGPQRCAIFRLKLRGTARQFLGSDPELPVLNNWDELVAAFRMRFSETEDFYSLSEVFRNCKQKAGETVAQFAGRLMRAAQKMNIARGKPLNTTERPELMVRRDLLKEDTLIQFLKGLDPRIRKFVQLRSPKTIQEAIKIAQVEELELQTEAGAPALVAAVGRPVPGSDACFNCGRAGHWASDCTNRPTCHRCGRTGHIAIDCRQGRPDPNRLSNMPGRGRGYSNPDRGRGYEPRGNRQRDGGGYSQAQQSRDYYESRGARPRDNRDYRDPSSSRGYPRGGRRGGARGGGPQRRDDSGWQDRRDDRPPREFAEARQRSGSPYPGGSRGRGDRSGGQGWRSMDDLREASRDRRQDDRGPPRSARGESRPRNRGSGNSNSYDRAPFQRRSAN